MACVLHGFEDWRRDNCQIYFGGVLVSGSLLMGSSIAYPMLSQDGSAWAPVAFATFFSSAAIFNALKLPEIYLYGHCTLLIGIIATLLVMTFGQTPLPEHAKFIPVYTMGSAFLNAAWPSLFRSNGMPPRTMGDIYDESADYQGYLPVPLEDVVVDNDSCPDLSTLGRNEGSSISHELQEHERQESPPVPSSPVPSSNMQDTQHLREPALCNMVRREDFVYMGPSSSYSGGSGSSHAGTSLSLGSYGRCPSEISSIVAAHFFPEAAASDVHTFSTQRRRDIQALSYSRSPWGEG